jgi:glycogen synthase
VPDEIRKVALFTNEYPPNVYGGAGVHVEYLGRALSRLVQVEVRCFGDQAVPDGNPTVRGYPRWEEAGQGHRPPLQGCPRRLPPLAGDGEGPLGRGRRPLPHWYTDMGGVLAAKLWGVPYVLTIHSLEPLRPWKVEQLGNAYHLSAWMERTAIEQADAIVAVSNETREDVLRHFAVDPARVHVVYNGIDPDEYRAPSPDDRTPALAKHGIDPSRPYALFVGRITRQKGIIHLVNAIPDIDPGLQVVLAAGAPDTPEIGAEMEARVAAVSAGRPGVIWIREMLPRPEVIRLYGHAAVFCCPSVYEPFGIINLEAMACETAVVASAVGGIKEVVVPEETGLLVDPRLKAGTFDPEDASGFSASLAAAINRVAGRRGAPTAVRRGRAAAGGRALQLGRDRAGDGGAVRVDV